MLVLCTAGGIAEGRVVCAVCLWTCYPNPLLVTRFVRLAKLRMAPLRSCLLLLGAASRPCPRPAVTRHRPHAPPCPTLLCVLHDLPRPQAQLAPTPSWGLAAPHRVQPRQYPHHDSCAADAPASCSLRALAGAPQLSDRWTVSKPPWRVSTVHPGGGMGGGLGGQCMCAGRGDDVLP
jgi:hypothetical protein